MGPSSRPTIRSGQWSQTTTGTGQPAVRLIQDYYAQDEILILVLR